MKLKRVSLELAKHLKALGFDLECRALYRPYCGDMVYENSININPIAPEPAHNDWVSAPTLELAKMWFREVHQILIEPTPITKKYFSYKIYREGEKFHTCKLTGNNNHLNTYEDALEAGIMYMCEIMIECNRAGKRAEEIKKNIKWE